VVRLAWIAAALALCAAAPVAADEGPAQPPTQGRSADAGWAYRLPGELMSPFCPGRTLADCPSPSAESLRLWLVVQEAAGRSKDDVEAELIARYGDVIRQAPKAEGMGLAAYVVPVVAFAAGGLLVAFFLRRVLGGGPASGSPAPGPPAAPLDPELERIVDRDLAR
jgi:cytochrome c-type biogenesis protein CcmH/NrfF